MSKLFSENIHGRKTLMLMIKAINEQHPGIVLLAGDMSDGNPEIVIKNKLGMEFSRLKSKYVYISSMAITNVSRVEKTVPVITTVRTFSTVKL
ncbi:hypothetical protein [Dysgonomonas termitidis]|uniref:Uncharacterized protein n=1 Tax=Dysgonomonas termitidis TaxID=1516126 RepID=A0ABV9KYB1_9BACT